MQIAIRNVNLWYPQCTEQTIAQALLTGERDCTWPIVDFVPPMQRRRLSAFAKMALFVAYHSTHELDQQIPVIFSSRHGDLHKTSGLLEELAHNNPLSPTAFGLSVHNAIPGLFSILTGNKQAINAIAAGQDSFMMALIDAYARLTSGSCQQVLVLHVDQHLPAPYLPFQDETQLSHALAMIISLPVSESEQSKNQEHVVSITHQQQSTGSRAELPAALTIADWLNSDKLSLDYQSHRYLWSLNKHIIETKSFAK